MPASTASRLHQRHLKALRATPLFSAYTPEEFVQLSKFCRPMRCNANTVLFREQEACSAIYLLLEGFVELYRQDNGGHKKVIEFISSGQTFAEAALFSGQGYPVSAITLLDSELLYIDGMRFSRFLQAYPQLMWRMLGTMSVRLHYLISHITSLGLHSAEQKVAAYLLQHCDEDSPGHEVMNLPNRRVELASRLSLSVETLCRILGNFRRKELIRTEDSSRIYILDTAELRALLD